jgi:hypothetical protein
LDFKIPYDLVAQGGQNDQKNLTFPNWWTTEESNLWYGDSGKCSAAFAGVRLRPIGLVSLLSFRGSTFQIFHKT